MAFINTTTTPHLPLGKILSAPLRGLGRFLVRIMESNSRVQAVEKLNSLSDDALARRGLKREDIVHHVFKDTYYV
ncbi:MAG: DUF1127 domain-containing protein [Brevirhabdus sp.]